jgi:hypothetical protein
VIAVSLIGCQSNEGDPTSIQDANKKMEDLNKKQVEEGKLPPGDGPAG